MGIWKQWKTGRTRVAALLKLGIPEHEASIAFQRRPAPTGHRWSVVPQRRKLSSHLAAHASQNCRKTWAVNGVTLVIHRRDRGTPFETCGNTTETRKTQTNGRNAWVAGASLR